MYLLTKNELPMSELSKVIDYTDRQTDRQTAATERIITPHSRVVTT